jgi:hypothetical protein
VHLLGSLDLVSRGSDKHKFRAVVDTDGVTPKHQGLNQNPAQTPTASIKMPKIYEKQILEIMKNAPEPPPSPAAATP